MKKLLSIIFLVAFAVNGVAQTTEGTVTYEMIMSSSDPMVQQQFDMMGASKMVLSFKDKDHATEMTNMFMVQKTIYNASSEKALMLNEMMGKKSAIHMTKDELKEKNSKESGDDDVEAKVTYFDEYKEIAGYKCQKVSTITEKGTSVMYVTTEFNPVLENSNFTSKNVKGFPLEMVMESNEGGYPVQITMTAQNVKNKVKDPSIFSLTVPKGYKEMTYDEFQNSMKAMRGGN